ncbi:MAG TPA: hypothetical protein VFG58_08135 [Solirubrobacterales bacterium]|nr:hypothetical protein [Solirubrobacterales bacterium]
MRRVAWLLGPGAVALLLTALIAAPGAGAAGPATASACKAASNIEAIVDDSGSMAVTDPDKLRVQGMSLLIDDLSPKAQLGAVEFGSGFEIPGFPSDPPASTVFPPEPVGPNAGSMRSSLESVINADNGATDYNGAFAKADADNPNSDARVFLTDGGHDVGDYNEAHLGHRVPTYVIGFGIFPGSDEARLKKIAKDTGGRYLPVKDASELQAAMNSIGAALTCQTPPRSFTDLLRQGQSKPHALAIGAKTKSIQITLTWANPLDKFKLVGLRLVGKRGLLATASGKRRHRKPSKLKVRTTSSSTFTILRVSRLKKGKLRFKVKALKVGSGSPKATLTTQVGQLRHR